MITHATCVERFVTAVASASPSISTTDLARPDECPEIDAVGRSEERLEVLRAEARPGAGTRRCHPVVVEHDERGVDAALGRPEETVGVVEETEVAEERDRRSG
jgi:hypothetical protein